MEEHEDFLYIDASVSTGSLASSEKSLLSSEDKHELRLKSVAEKLVRKSVEFSDQRLFHSPPPGFFSSNDPSPPDVRRRNDEFISKELSAIFGGSSAHSESAVHYQKFQEFDFPNQSTSSSSCQIVIKSNGKGTNGHTNHGHLNGDKVKTVMDNCGKRWWPIVLPFCPNDYY